MAQLPYIEPEAADPITRQVYDKTVARFQMVLNIFKISGNAPENDGVMPVFSPVPHWFFPFP